MAKEREERALFDNETKRAFIDELKMKRDLMRDGEAPVQEVKFPKFSGFGKRKSSQATAEIILGGTGKITINGKPFHKYFAHPGDRSKIMLPISLANRMADMDVKIRVVGGGVSGQAEAIIPALSKALVKYDPLLKKLLKNHLCMRTDPRMTEIKRPGRIKARKGYVYNRR